MNQFAATGRRPRDLVVTLVALVLPSFITWLYFYQAEGAAAGVQLAVFNVVKIVQFALPAVWVLAVQRSAVKLRPATSRGAGIGLTFGAIVAVATLALYFAWLRHSPQFSSAAVQIRDKLAGWHIDSPAKFAALGIFYSLIHSLLEEYYWRWFVFGQLRRWTSFHTAIAISALGFMAHHVLVLGRFFGPASPLTWLLSACVAVGGAFWAWLYEKSGSLVGPWLSHMLVDGAIFACGYDVVRASLVT